MPKLPLPRARVIFPRPETENLLAAWIAYDARLKAEPSLSAATEERRDIAADALYDVMYLACSAMTKADVPAPQSAAA